MAALICSIAAFVYPLKLSAALPGPPLQPEAKIAGTITMRNGEVMNVTTSNGKTVEVVLNSDTKIEKPEGVAGFRKKRLDVTALAPGLSVTVQGTQYENNQLIAKIVMLSPHGLQSTNTVHPPPRLAHRILISLITARRPRTMLTLKQEAPCYLRPIRPGL